MSPPMSDAAARPTMAMVALGLDASRWPRGDPVDGGGGCVADQRRRSPVAAPPAAATSGIEPAAPTAATSAGGRRRPWIRHRPSGPLSAVAGLSLGGWVEAKADAPVGRRRDPARAPRPGPGAGRGRPAGPTIGAARRLGHDDRHHDVEPEEEAPAQEHQDDPDDPDERRIEVEALGDAAGHPGEHPLVARAVQPVVHSTTSRRIELDAPGVRGERQVDLDRRRSRSRGSSRSIRSGRGRAHRSCSRRGPSSTGSGRRPPTAGTGRGSRR